MRENSRPMPGESSAAPLTPNGEPSAAVIAAIARASSSRRMTIVASLSGFGSKLERRLGEEAERAMRAAIELDQIEAGDVLHHPAAGA